MICVNTEQAEKITYEMHRGDCGSHLFWKATSYRILRVGFYWNTLFSNVFSEVRSCVECKRFASKQKVQSLPLQPVVSSAPFQQWGLDFIREINPHSSGQHKYILTATDKVTMNFISDNICSRFGCPRKLVTGNAQAFKSTAMIELCNKYNIILMHSTPYYPLGNGLIESFNKSLVRIIKNLLVENKISWDYKLKFALWANRISTKKSIGTSPFQLIYGIDAVIPVQLGMSIMKIFHEDGEE